MAFLVRFQVSGFRVEPSERGCYTKTKGQEKERDRKKKCKGKCEAESQHLYHRINMQFRLGARASKL